MTFLSLQKGMPQWPDSESFKIERTMSMERGDSANVSSMKCDLHTGTHIETPLHFVKEGKSIDKLSLDRCCGTVFVMEMTQVDTIKESNLSSSAIPDRTERLLFKTTNSTLWQEGATQKFTKNYVALAECAAKWVVDKGIRLVGIDYLSIQHYDDSSEVHRILLEADVAVLEGINLSGVEPGQYELICLPLKLLGAEASPCRAILRPLKSFNNL